MIVGYRFRAARLAEMLDQNKEYAEKIGVSIEWKSNEQKKICMKQEKEDGYEKRRTS